MGLAWGRAARRALKSPRAAAGAEGLLSECQAPSSSCAMTSRGLGPRDKALCSSPSARLSI